MDNALLNTIHVTTWTVDNGRNRDHNADYGVIETIEVNNRSSSVGTDARAASLTNELDTGNVFRTIQQSSSPETDGQQRIAAANASGGHDNIAVVLVHLH